MGSLSNLYISQSYQSLIHLATNNTASATLIDLQDGLGNSIGVSVNTGGDLSLSGSFTASLQQGYVYVGDANGKTTLVSTSSFIDTFNSSSLVTTASFNAYTQSNDSKVNSLINATASYAISSSVAAVDAAQQSQINSLIAASGSYLTSSIPLTSLNEFTASQNTKNTTLESVTSSLNQFTSSANNRLNNLESTSASVNISIANINSTTASQAISISNLNTFSQSAETSINNLTAATASYANSASVAVVDAAQQSQINSLIAASGSYLTSSVPLTSLNEFTASQLDINTGYNTFTSSANQRLTSIESVSGSWITESETASFARTNVDNNFTANQTFTNITAVSASFTYVQTTFETSSVIYSSGSNIFGDELTDIQTLSGSVKVQGSLTVNGTPVLTSSVDISGLVTTASFNAYTESNDSKVNSLINATASYANSASVALVDAGQQLQIDNLIAATGSYLTSSVPLTSLNEYTQSNDAKWNTLGGQTGSYVTSTITASSLVTASVNLNTITFTKGDATTFNITVDTGSAITTDITSLNAFTASQETKDTTLESVTASLQAFTASQQILNGTFTTTASFNSYTQSNDQRVSSLESNSASVNISISNINSATASLLIETQNLELFSASALISLSNLNTATASLFTSTSLSLTTASLSGQTLTFTKGNGTTFGIVLPDVSGSDITSLNAFTASQLDINAGYNTFTASANSSISNLNSATASLFNSASLALITASFDNGTRNLTFTKGDTQTFSVNIPDVSGSAGTFVTTSSFNAYTASNDQRVSSLETNSASVNISISNLNASSASQQLEINSLIAATGSYVTSAITASSLITASFSGNTLTFTKGDSSTFGVVIPDVSGSTIPAGTISSSAQISALGFVSSSVTASSLVTASVSLNTITFTKGDASTFNITVDTGSAVTTDLTSLNAFTASQETKDTTLASVTSSLNSATASLFTSASLALVTASVNLNTITFTKGDTSTFAITVNTGSGGGATLPSGLLSSSVTNFIDYSASVDSRINAAGGAPQVQDEGTILGNASSFNFNGAGVTATLSAGTASITIPGGGGGSTDTGSLLVTASFNTSTRDITFTKGDASTFKLGAFAITGSNTFIASQTINSNNALTISGSSFGYGITLQGQQGISLQGSGGPRINFPNNTWLNGNENDNFQFTGDTNDPKTRGMEFFLYGTGSRNMTFRNESGPSAEIKFQTTGSGASFTNLSLQQNQSTFARVLRLADWNNNVNISMVNVSGSLSLTPNSFNATTASLLHLSASNNNSLINLVFKNNNSTGDTIISGSNNIFTNPPTPTTGYTRYIGGANNLYLNNTNGVNSQITASAASVSGNRPTMNNNIFNGTSVLNINQAVNGGTHTYSNNIFGGTSTNTINAMAFTGSLTLQNNINNGSITINAASASFNEITGGFSGSHTISLSNNNNQGSITITTNRNQPGNINPTYSGNIINGGGSLIITNHSSSVAVNASNNFLQSSISYNNVGAAGLGLHRTTANITGNYGALSLIASASAISAQNNISPAAISVTNRMYSGSFGSGSLTFNNNQVQGATNTYTVSGSYGGTGTGATMLGNGVFGSLNTFFTNVEGRGMYVDFRSNLIGGQSLILTGSNNNAITASGGAYFGRFNADDGRRNQTAENIFFVGTGTSASNRKTGFLIDSGSNTYVEGTLNVSGSTSLTGSLTIQSGSSFFANGNKQFNVGAFQSNVTQSGSAGVSQSMNFETTDISSGVSIVSNSQITLANSGTYNIQFSAQILADTGADDVYIWLKKNGTNVSASAGHVVLANNEELIAAWNYVVDAAASDYFELAWQNTQGDAVLLSEAASGNIPSIPSIILTVTQVR
jgi:hypothetical protein